MPVSPILARRLLQAGTAGAACLLVGLLSPDATAQLRPPRPSNNPPPIAAFVRTHLGVRAGVSSGPDRLFIGVHSDQFWLDRATGRNTFGGLLLRLDSEAGAADGFRRVTFAAGLGWDRRSGIPLPAVYGSLLLSANFYVFDPPQPRTDCCFNPGVRVLVGLRSARGFFVEGSVEAGRGPRGRVAGGYMVR